MAGPAFHDSELAATMARKVRELEQQVKAQADELLSKVGPGGERARVRSEGWRGSRPV